MPKIIKDMKKRIIDVAEMLFLEEFYIKVDARRIAKELGVSVGTLYNYFPTKQDIFLAVVERKFSDSKTALIESLKGKNREAALKNYICVLYDITEKNSKLFKSLHYLFTIEDKVIVEKTKTGEKYYQNLVNDTIVQEIEKWYIIDTKTEKEILKRVITTIRVSTLFYIKNYDDDDQNKAVLTMILLKFLADFRLKQGENS